MEERGNPISAGEDTGPTTTGTTPASDLMVEYFERPFVDAMDRDNEEFVYKHYTLITPKKHRPLPGWDDKLERRPYGDGPGMVYLSSGDYAFDQTMKAGCGCFAFLMVMFLISFLLEMFLH